MRRGCAEEGRDVKRSEGEEPEEENRNFLTQAELSFRMIDSQNWILLFWLKATAAGYTYNARWACPLEAPC